MTAELLHKPILRRKMTDERNLISVQEILIRSKNIFTKIPAEIITSEVLVHCYIGSIKKKEINTLGFIAELLRKNISVHVPFIDSEKVMHPAKLTDLEELVEAPFGLLQPKEIVRPVRDSFDVIFVPGLAFDRRGNRLGYGKGYYDRFLNEQKNALKIGLCFDFQLLDEIHAEAHDVPVDWIISEKELLKVNSKI